MTSQISPDLLNQLIGLALEEAIIAEQEAEVPIGAVICELSPVLSSGTIRILARAHNRVEQRHDATAHAEMLAIQEASRHMDNWRLTDSVLVCTLEPCVMCLGALRLARIPMVVFGAGDSRFGALGSVYNLNVDDKTGSAPSVIGGVRKSECADILKRFFESRRE